MEQKVAINRTALNVDASNLSIEHGTVDTQILRDRRRQIREAAKQFPISGDQLSLVAFNVRESPETVDLQFEEMVIRIERFRPRCEPHWAQVLREGQHAGSIPESGLAAAGSISC